MMLVPMSREAPLPWPGWLIPSAFPGDTCTAPESFSYPLQASQEEQASPTPAVSRATTDVFAPLGVPWAIALRSALASQLLPLQFEVLI